jgi:ribosomal protein S18 acetylase RimI-like enzyme
MADPDSHRSTALAFIVECQQDPSTATAFLGEDPAGIEAELEGLEEPWLDGFRFVGENGAIVAACTVDWDPEPSMAWLHGPWGAPEQVARHGRQLLADAARAVPAGIERFELCGHVANTAMAGLAAELGWTATEVNFAMVLPAAEARRWDDPDAGAAPGVRIRRMAPSDVGLVEPLHAAEFAEAHATARQLLTRHLTMVADGPAGQLLGYAAGMIQDDGQAYVDFTAVDPQARRRGLGRRLVTALVRELLATSSPDLVHLTVRQSRTAAQALYLSLGMRQDAALRGYRGPRPVA